ncbi:exonuclease SbcCD subunit D [Periweissella beninensis]|uniref:Nuclease SbcCD subunit D n=1 Tax=Periweissella beninensis TaxID=504936 RepID=A0ABT0VL58_9LACO|nr:exonuclease SbcCD subunit D [Periweissella beninensis]MBM7544970.1 exonuclease SbcD [Periweissella beninensis]MCM2437215.1 exonuclease SbcCD subunit D [Periweissella beninensis]MCT4397017.1 exonuclease SbcCD subunit D [Periweissella beninensis]
MRFLHTADWHIGKQLNQYDLLEVQKDAFRQIKAIAKKAKVDGIIVAGDLYDRAIPATRAIGAFDQMLKELNIELGLPIYAIAGNHDGANRLNFARSWFGKNELYLNTQLAEAFTPIENDECQVFLLPFFDPQDARIYYHESIESGNLRTINQAMQRVIADMIKQFKPEKRHILVTHFNVQGQDNQDYELTSETTSIVGGLKSIDSNLLTAFDYVALGHLHLWQASPNQKMRYSGSPVKFNTKEAKNKKGVYIVDVPKSGAIKYEFAEIKPLKDLIVIKATYTDLITATFYKQYPHKGQAFFSIKILDRPQVKNVRQNLEQIYGDIVEIEYMPAKSTTEAMTKMVKRTQLSETALIGQFYQDVTKQTINEHQQQIIEDILVELKREQEK